jgi:hypothetical protein
LTGWIVLNDDGASKVVSEDEKAPYRANQQLMIPLGSLLRRKLVLSASHASAQWFLLEKLAGLIHLQAG